MPGKQGFASMDKKRVRQISRKGGAAGTGHRFAHGKLDPTATGRLGGRPPKERFFIADSSEIGDDFTPSWRDRLLRRTR